MSNYKKISLLNILNEFIDQLLLLLSMNGLSFVNVKTSYENIQNIIIKKQEETEKLQRFYTLNSINEAKLENFHIDICYCISIINQVISSDCDLEICNNIRIEQSLIDKDENDLVDKYTEVLNQISTFRDKLKNEKFNFNKEFNAYKDELRIIKKNFYENKMENAVKLGYIEKYEESKLDQLCLKNEMIKVQLKESKENLEFEIDKELTIHSEIEKYFAEIYEDVSKIIENWNEKLDKDNVQKILELQEVIEQKELLEKNYHKKKQLYEQRENDMNEFLKYKKEKQDREFRIKIEIIFAKKIQKWWRNILHKKHLKKKKSKKVSKKKAKRK